MAWTNTLALQRRLTVARATATTAIGTSNTNVAGLSANVVLGTYLLECEVHIVNSGTPTETDFLFGAGGGLVVSNMMLNLKRCGGTSGGTLSLNQITALNTSAGTNLSAVIYARIFGSFQVTTAGTIGLQAIRVAGTSATVQTGSFMRLTPV